MRRVRRRREPHSPTCRHCPRVRLLGQDYQSQRAAWETAREAATYGYRTEEREYDREHPPPTFKSYLIAMAGTGWPMSGQQPARRSAA